MSITTDEARAIDQVADRLHQRFPDAQREIVKQAVERVHHTYDGRPIREFVPVLVEREVSEALAVDHTHRSGRS
jgi:predicted metalloprotease with PDZ domain